MGPRTPIPLVRCRLSGANGDRLRYIRATEFGLWRHLMESRHGRAVEIEDVSVWVDEELARNSELFPQAKQPVLLLRLELPGPWGFPVPVERFVPAEDLEAAREALLQHYALRMRPEGPTETRGYFVAGPSLAAADSALSAARRRIRTSPARSSANG